MAGPRKTREEVGDIALYHMEKINRRYNDRASQTFSLAEQLAEEERKRTMSPGKILSELSFPEWTRRVMEKADKKETQDKYDGLTRRFVSWCFTNVSTKRKMTEFHESGANYPEIFAWMVEKQVDYNNR